jgi:phage/plasmid-like protein (TIGR03299 family)
MAITYAERTPSFQRLGTKVSAGLKSSEMLQEADLSGWNVRTVAGAEIIDRFEVPNNMYFTVRDTNVGTEQILGAVKSRYVPVQNEDAFSWADDIIEGGGKWDSAGSFRNSALVFGAMEIDSAQVSVDPEGLNDVIKMYLLVSNSHDGSRPLQATVTPIRVVCQNTLTAALKSVQSFKVKHTASAERNAMVARDALNITFKYAKEFDILANKMYKTTFTDQQFDELVNKIYPKPEIIFGKEGKPQTGNITRWQSSIDIIYDLRKADTNRNIYGTAWGAYNVLTEKLDWFRKSNDEEATAVAASGFALTANIEKQNILDNILGMSGIAVH